MRLFLDANVLFAASVSPQGRSASLFLFASRQECTLLPSPHVVTEARRNLDAKAPDAVARFRELLGLVTVVPEAPTRIASAVSRSRRNAMRSASPLRTLERPPTVAAPSALLTMFT